MHGMAYDMPGIGVMQNAFSQMLPSELRNHHLQCMSVGASAGVREQGVDPLATIELPREIAEAVLVTCGLLLALHNCCI